MDSTRRIARLAFIWALIGTGAASRAVAQEVFPAKAAPAVKPTAVAPRLPWDRSLEEAPRVGPRLEEPFQSFRPEIRPSEFSLADRHVIVVSTLTLVLVGIIVILLIA